jgi:hypothetical protein
MIERSASTEAAGIAYQTSFGTSRALSVGSMIVTLLLTLCFAWLLIFRAEWLADKLKISNQDDHHPLSGPAILGAGTRILGLFVMVMAAPELLKPFLEMISFSSVPSDVRDSMADGQIRHLVLNYGFWTGVLPSALKLFLGFLLAFKTQAVLNMMSPLSNPDASPTPQDNT